MKLLLLTLILTATIFAQSTPSVVINELQAANSSTISDPDFRGQGDWIELYNTGSRTVDLGGWFLTDDPGEPQQWQIPAGTSIRPGWHALFWADGYNTGRHTNFSLSRDGEFVGLYAADSSLVDSLSFGPQQDDFSYGRSADGGETFLIFAQPTPATANTSQGYQGVAGAVTFSQPGGFYSGSQSIVLSASHIDEDIHYSINGAVPTQQSAKFRAVVQLDTSTVIRARAFREGYLPGPVITHTYLIDEQVTLPVVSIATDPANLWDDETGIYVEGTNGIPGYCTSQPRNWNQPWEKPAHVEMFETDGTPGFKLDAGIQIGGGCTRLYPQKSLAVYARAEYGAAKINYKIFADKEIDTFNNVLLRNNGQDWWRAMHRDGMMQTIVKDRMDIDWQAYRPALLFLNGAYWGIHPMREKHNEHYLAANHGLDDPDAIDILTNNANVKQGSADLYEAMIDFVETHDLSQAQNYDYMRGQMDINEYLNYVIAEIYFANIDWPGGNIKYWRAHGEGNKWRWIIFDTDLGFGAHGRGEYDSNTLENATSETETYYANPPWSTLLLRSLLENDDFRTRFIQRFAMHLNSTFAPARVLQIADSIRGDIAAEMPRHIAKWPKSTSFSGGWQYHIDKIKEFAEKRPGYVFNHIRQKFDLSGNAQLRLTINDSIMGRVQINAVDTRSADFEGTFFKDVPIRLKAIPAPGYRFAGWQGASQSMQDSIALTLSADADLQAIFTKSSDAGLRINEFMALNNSTISDPEGSYEDWIELHNFSGEPIDVGGLYITDDLQQPQKWQIPATQPDSTTIAPGGFLLLWADEDTGDGVLHVDIKLSGNGEELGIGQMTDSGFAWIDTLVFGTQTADVSYGRYPDGSGDFTVLGQPTPGGSNILTAVEEETPQLPQTTQLLPNYPNPFNPTTTIRYILARAGHVTLTVYDISGRNIATLLDGRQSGGVHSVVFDASDLPSGVYIVTLRSAAITQSKKMLLLR